MAEIVEVLDSISPLSVSNNYVSQVEEFASQINRIYGQRNLSAASKLLWIKCKCPVIILDSRAQEALKKELKKKSKQGYKGYCDTWRDAYSEKRNEIVSAVSKLESVIEFSFDSSASKSDVKVIVGNEWFVHRVFDNYLWHVGDEIIKRSTRSGQSRCD